MNAPSQQNAPEQEQVQSSHMGGGSIAPAVVAHLSKVQQQDPQTIQAATAE